MSEHQKSVRLASQKRLASLIDDFYKEAHECANTKRQPIAWVSTAAPVELLWTMGYFCLFPEAHSATCGGRKVADYHCQVTEGRGYETHLCTYARNDLGWVLAGDEHQSPVGGLPRPDLLMCANNSCTTVQKWWENQSRNLRVPLIVIDTPYLGSGTNEMTATTYVKKQLLAAIGVLEQLTGRRFDYDLFGEIVRSAQENSRLYQGILAMNKADPAPASVFDIFPQNFPMLTMRYKFKATEHYLFLEHELEERIAEKTTPFTNLKYRIYWDGAPSWFALGSIAKKLNSLGLCVITSSYADVFSFKYLDGDRPLDSLAENCVKFHLNRDATFKRDFVNGLFRDFTMHGAIFQYAESCKPFTITQSYIEDYVRRELGLPTVSFEADLVDSRFYTEEEAFLRFEALLEALESRV